ncbi:MAG: HPt (histidine-containing phosphotransfer) domain-containing protein, partial [bacterium]
EIVNKWLLPSQKENESEQDSVKNENNNFEKKQDSTEVETPIDIKKAINEFEGDEEFFVDVTKEFLKEVELQIQKIQQAIDDNDADLIGKEAHAIKGGSANLTAMTLSKIAHNLEKIGKSGDLSNVDLVFDNLQLQVKELNNYLSVSFEEW